MTLLSPSSLITSSIGGLTILGAVNLDLKLEKRVPSPSGIFYNMITLDSDTKWRSSFIAGFMFTSALAWTIFRSQQVSFLQTKLFETPEEFLSDINVIGFMICGFLVGVGSKLANGGLTKFGFYELPRFTKRGVLSLLLILAVGSLFATIEKTSPFFHQQIDMKSFAEGFDTRIAVLIPIAMFLISLYKAKARHHAIVSCLAGCLLSMGEMISGMAQRHKMINFLAIGSSWDPFLLLVLVSGILSNYLLYKVLFQSRKDQSQDNSSHPHMSPKSVLGCCFLGAGLGISGLTPGSALLVLPVYFPHVALFFLPFAALGQFSAEPMGTFILDKLQINHMSFKKAHVKED